MKKLNEKKKFRIHPGHSMPKTRRQFLSQGMISASSYAVLPTIFDLLLRPNSASAAVTCPGEGQSGKSLPFIIIDCAGGANISYAFLPKGQGGLLPSYDTFGLPDAEYQSQTVDTRFGAPLNTFESNIRSSMLAECPDALAGLSITTVANDSQDDTSNNRLSPLLHISKASLPGTLIASGLGTENSTNGGNSASPLLRGALKPMRIRNIADITSAVNIGGALQNMTRNQKEVITNSLVRLSDSQFKKLSNLNLLEQASQLSHCGYLKNVDNAQDRSALVDPRNSDAMVSVYGDDMGVISDADALRDAGIVYNALQGKSGPGAIEIGDCDYHNDGRETTNAKDSEIGRTVGKVLQAASKLNTEVLIALITDGGISSDKGSPDFESDENTHGMAVMLNYRPPALGGRRDTLNTGQAGLYTEEGQAVDLTTYVGNVPERVSHVIFANWLHLQGRLNEFEKYVSNRQFDLSKLDNHILFKK